MEDYKDKLPIIRKIVYVLAVILIFEIVMLFLQIPEKSNLPMVTIAAIAFVCVYFVLLSLRLIKEIKNISEKKDDLKE